MKKEYWIYTLISILIVAIAIIGFFVFVHFKYGDQSGQSHKSETKNYEDIHIAIVNEDQSTTYNGKKITLGDTFVKKLSSQTNYNFETVTRNIAENGLKDGKYQVMIIIPENFSKLSMQLDKKKPANMAIQYKTAVGQKEEVAKKTEKIVASILNDFNKDLIKIYLTSIIDNLHNAQKNVGAIMTREQNVNQNFANYLLNPLNDFPELFTDTLVNSINANNDITKWLQGYNNSLLSAKPEAFSIQSDNDVSSIVGKQAEYFNAHQSLLEDTLDDMKSRDKDVNISDYINQLKQVDSKLDQQHEAQQRTKDDYQKSYQDALNKVKDEVKAQESPFTEDMIRDYRQKLTASLQEQLKNNQDLNDIVDQMKQDQQKIQDTMANQLRNAIENDQSGQDEFYIRKLTNKDIADAGLSEKATKEYQEILKEVNQYRTSYNVKHLDNPIKQEDYHGEISATDTSKLETEGTTFERQEDIKSKDINHLTVSTDPNFDFSGDIYINGKKYDIKDQNVKLDTTVKTYHVKVKGVAKLKADAQHKEDFLKNKTMKLQLLFGQADNDKDEPKANVVDLSINNHLDGKLISGDLNQQLRSLDQFKSKYDIYKDVAIDPNDIKIDNKAIVDMMVNQVIKDMESFKNDKSALLNQLDQLNQQSDKFIDDVINNQDQVAQNKKDISTLLDELSKAEKLLSDEPETPKINEEKGKEFTTISTDLDKQISDLSERSTKLLSDSQNSKSTADDISGELNKLDDNVGKLHASGRALGVRANNLNEVMNKNDKENRLFAKDFENVLKNSKEGDRQNEVLKDFMSNPIQKKNLENVLANSDNHNTFSPTILVLLMYLVSLMTAYLFYSYERHKGQVNFVKDEFSKHNHWWNKGIGAGIVTIAGLAEGLIIGLIAMNQYEVMAGYRAKFVGLIILTMIVFVLLNTYLLRQLKSIGMFIIIVILALYFIDMNRNNAILAAISPLSHIDKVFYNYLNAEHPVGMAMLILAVLAIIGFILNMFIKHFKKERLI
ncbi:type VII secretion protein EsaA [Staphylococcus lugdunensis]|uniref:Type VII secretion system accessory factor EsaA n=1 Tax=Staphylococcus lugdunensis TaxID=28035 RepID=A0ABD4EGU2_STALU|nr:type VII secretion protein EsaA [Staphylococcus lugdunensis]EFU84243.1 type VII secretion protein EsaA [Staphylococcus lugdunensis M23590]KXA39203.1 type VII secretion protein EsaA [Staphylococcus lugdunensis]SQE72280.1 secretion accessory protein EsaA/YueB [Staphylococcus lugdunensis]